MTTQQDNAPDGFRSVGTVAGVPPVRWLVHEQCGIPVMGGCAEEHREWCERVTGAGKAHADRAVQPTIKPHEMAVPKVDEGLRSPHVVAWLEQDREQVRQEERGRYRSVGWAARTTG